MGEPYQLQRSPEVTLDEEDELPGIELELTLDELLGVELELELATTEDDLELTTELLEEDDEAEEFKPKKRIASAAFTGRL
jgi:hypothetical protein